MKRIILLLLLGVLILSFCATAFTRKLPHILTHSLETNLNRRVAIGDVKVVYPFGLEISELVIYDNGLYEKEPAFKAHKVRAEIQVGSLLERRLDFRKIVVEEALWVIRKHRGANQKEERVSSGTEILDLAPKSILPNQGTLSGADIRVAYLAMKNGAIRFIDYDLDKGFAIDLTSIEAEMKPAVSKNGFTALHVVSKIIQGRTKAAANLEVRGFFNPKTGDADIKLDAEDVWLPFYGPYLAKVTSSRIHEGLTRIQSKTTVLSKQWSTNARLNIRRLEFSSYESGKEIFGLDAETLVNLLKDKSGDLVLDLAIEGDLADPNLTIKSVIRNAIHKSLKKTLLSNIHNVVGNTIEQIADDPNFFKKDWKGVLQDIREIID